MCSPPRRGARRTRQRAPPCSLRRYAPVVFFVNVFRVFRVFRVAFFVFFVFFAPS